MDIFSDTGRGRRNTILVVFDLFRHTDEHCRNRTSTFSISACEQHARSAASHTGDRNGRVILTLSITRSCTSVAFCREATTSKGREHGKPVSWNLESSQHGLYVILPRVDAWLLNGASR